MVERPTGTVTFLFTDVEGSTRLWEQHPVEMRAALERHDQLLRSAIARHDGAVFSTAGDAFAAAFADPADAVGAAVAAQRELGDEPWPGLLPSALSAPQRWDEAIDVAVAEARIHGNELWTCHALWAYGLAHSGAEGGLAAVAWQEGLAPAREHRISILIGFLARDAASFASEDTPTSTSRLLFDEAIESFHEGGNVVQLVITLAALGAFLERSGRDEAAARVYGATANQDGAPMPAPGLVPLAEPLESKLGDAAVQARDQIRGLLQQVEVGS